MNEILAIIPARGGSKGIPRKNIHLLGGKPLLWYTAKAALESRFISRCVLSTDDTEIADLGSKFGLEVPFLRPEEYAKDDTPGIDVILHTVQELYNIEGYMPDAVVILQPTSPMRTERHIDEAIEMFISSEADSLVSVVDVPHQYNPYSVMRLEGKYLSPFLDYPERDNLRQKKPHFLARNGAAIYIVDSNLLLNKNTLFGKKLIPYMMREKDSIDIDTDFDLEIAELLIKKTSTG